MRKISGKEEKEDKKTEKIKEKNTTIK